MSERPLIDPQASRHQHRHGGDPDNRLFGASDRNDDQDGTDSLQPSVGDGWTSLGLADPEPVFFAQPVADKISGGSTPATAATAQVSVAKVAASAAAAPALTGIEIFDPNTSGAYDDGDNGSTIGSEQYYSGSAAFSRSDLPRIAFATFDAQAIQKAVTSAQQAGDTVHVEISYTIVSQDTGFQQVRLDEAYYARANSVGGFNQDGQQEIEQENANVQGLPFYYLNGNFPAEETVVASPVYSFNNTVSSISIDTDATAQVAAAANAGRDLVLALNEIDDSHDQDYDPVDYLEAPQIRVITTAPAPSPTISGTEADQHLNAGASDMPFAGVTLADPATTGAGDEISLTILDQNGNGTDGDGTLVETNGAALTHDAGGNYFITGAPSLAALQADLQDLRFTAATGAGGTKATFEIDLQSTSGSTTDNENTSVIIQEACFAAGTLIATPGGERPVESIAPGDVVATAEGPRAVVWCGRRTVDVSRLPEPEDRWLVRIRCDAFGAGVPRRDLWVTQEHGILVEGGLMPARMLVNGGSILLDRTRPRYTYYHIELERHGILFAEGLSTESYLDTGNRAAFSNAVVPSLRPMPPIDPGHAGWATDAAAPLLVERERVEPVWRGLAARSASLGFGTESAATTDNEPDLRLLLSCGRTLSACERRDGRFSFRLPPGAHPVRLLSRSARPSDSIGPFVDDRRRLGVAVERLVLWQGLDDSVVPAADLALPGWHQAEGGVRWTDGAALLDLPAAGDTAMLDVHVAATMSYRPTVAELQDVA